jgi:hypothetical protein
VQGAGIDAVVAVHLAHAFHDRIAVRGVLDVTRQLHAATVHHVHFERERLARNGGGDRGAHVPFQCGLVELRGELTVHRAGGGGQHHQHQRQEHP